MANYPQGLAEDAVCQSHTGHMTGLWFLPARPLRLNTNEWWMNCKCYYRERERERENKYLKPSLEGPFRQPLTLRNYEVSQMRQFQAVHVTVAERSKAWVCDHSLAGIADSNSAGAWISVSCECCLLSGRGLGDELITCPRKSYRVWCVWVWSWSLDNEETLADQGLLRAPPWGGWGDFTRDQIKRLYGNNNGRMTVCKKLRELLIIVTSVLFYAYIYLYSFCFPITKYRKDNLKPIPTF